VGFAMVSKYLSYVSFMGNDFNLLNAVVRNNGSESGQSSIGDILETSLRVDSLVATMITQTWGSLAPHIDDVLQAHNAASEEFDYSSKQIIIDKSIPPITILDPVKKPMGKYERVKYVLVRVGLFGLGVLITFVPSILPWLISSKTEVGSN
jgi:hypothetical protein